MRHRIQDTIPAAAARFLTGTLLLALLVSRPRPPTRDDPAMQLIPSIGYTKGTDYNAGDGKLSGGLALRAALLPFLSVEGAITYRQESFFDDEPHGPDVARDGVPVADPGSRGCTPAAASAGTARPMTSRATCCSRT